MAEGIVVVSHLQQRIHFMNFTNKTYILGSNISFQLGPVKAYNTLNSKNLVRDTGFSDHNRSCFPCILRLLERVHTRVTRLGNFRPSSDLESFFDNYLSSPHFLGHGFPKLRLCIKYDKNLVGLRFGRFFHTLIWSPLCVPT
jgi:hypothetical protein